MSQEDIQRAGGLIREREVKKGGSLYISLYSAEDLIPFTFPVWLWWSVIIATTDTIHIVIASQVTVLVEYVSFKIGLDEGIVI